MSEARWQALGTGVVLRLTDTGAMSVARAIVEAQLSAIDRACSRFRADSELSRVNANAGSPVVVDRLLIEALQVALRAARLTDGDVAPTLGAQLVLAGYDRDWALLSPVNSSSMPLSRADSRSQAPSGPVRSVRRSWESIGIVGSSVRVPAGVQLDLGATAKAGAADRAAGAVHEATGSGVLVSLGGDIAIAGAPPPGGWRVHVTDDHRAGPDAPGQTVAISSGGLATSSITVRRWRQHGVERHHVIDPASGAPAAGPWRTVSVAAASCTDANIATTAALVRGARAAGWLESLALPARLVSLDGRVRTLGGWPRAAATAEPVAA